MKLPQYAVKPKHKKEVVASENGWIVKETGELLVRVRGLLVLLKRLEDNGVIIDTPQITKPDITKEQPDKIGDKLVAQVEEYMKTEAESKEEPKAVVKKRGRPAKSTQPVAKKRGRPAKAK